MSTNSVCRCTAITKIKGSICKNFCTRSYRGKSLCHVHLRQRKVTMRANRKENLTSLMTGMVRAETPGETINTSSDLASTTDIPPTAPATTECGCDQSTNEIRFNDTTSPCPQPSQPCDTPTEEQQYGTCCFCEEPCNPCSQACGRCMRRM